MSSRRGIAAALIINLIGSLSSAGKSVDPAKSPTSLKGLPAESRTSAAELLVHDALAAELSGDDARRNARLAEALKLDPNSLVRRIVCAVIWLGSEVR